MATKKTTDVDAKAAVETKEVTGKVTRTKKVAETKEEKRSVKEKFEECDKKALGKKVLKGILTGAALIGAYALGKRNGSTYVAETVTFDLDTSSEE